MGAHSPPQEEGQDSKNLSSNILLKKIQLKFFFTLLMWVKSLKVSTQFPDTSSVNTAHGLAPPLEREI